MPAMQPLAGLWGTRECRLATDMEALTGFGDVLQLLDFAGKTRRNLFNT